MQYVEFELFFRLFSRNNNGEDDFSTGGASP